MKENIFDVLIYLFENYLDSDLDLIPDSEGIKTELLEAGFDKREVYNAFDWLEALAEPDYIAPNLCSGFRIFSSEEQRKLDKECRDLLLFLENNNILTATTREIVIDRAMAFKQPELSPDELKWTVLMVLLSQSDDTIAFSRMEDIVYDLTPNLLH